MTQQQTEPVQLTVIPGDWEQVAAQANQRAAQVEAALNAAIRRIRELEQTLAQPEPLADASPNGVPYVYEEVQDAIGKK
jgi:hypothetical protein